MPFYIKRAYDHPEKNDGYCILIDRLRPRGISKEELQLNDWFKELALSTKLRKGFDHDSEKFEEFQERYHRELDKKPS